MKKSIIHYLTGAIAMIAAMSCAFSCTEEPEKEEQPGELPVIEDMTVAAGEEGVIEFDAPSAWTISSDKTWFVLDTKTGGAGAQSVPYTVTEENIDFVETSATVSLVFSDDRKVEFKVTRSAAEREMKISTDEEGANVVTSVNMLQNEQSGFYNTGKVYVTANYDWYYSAPQSSSWLVLDGLSSGLVGEAGETVELSFSLDMDKAPVLEQTGKVVFVSDDEQKAVELQVQFAGFGEDYLKIVEVREDGSEGVTDYGGSVFTNDGKVFISGAASERTKVTIKITSAEEYVLVVTTVNTTWLGGGATGMKVHYMYPYGENDEEAWLTISKPESAEAASDEGGTLMSSTYVIKVKDNEAVSGSECGWETGAERIANVLCMPKSIWESEIAASGGKVTQQEANYKLTGIKVGPGQYLLKEEYEKYVAFTIKQQAADFVDVDCMVMTNDNGSADPAGKLEELAPAKYQYTYYESGYEYQTPQKRPMNTTVQFPRDYTGITVKNRISKPEGHEGSNPYSFSDCDWLTFDLFNGNNNKYSFYVQALPNGEEQERSYTIVFIDGAGAEIGSLKVIQPGYVEEDDEEVQPE